MALANGKGDSLESNDAYEQIADELPDERLATAWLSPGLTDFLFRPRGALASFDTFVNAAGGKGAGAALSFDGDTIDLTVRSAQDPKAPTGEQDFFAALPQFKPSLAGHLGADTLAYLGLGDPAASARSLIRRAEQTAPQLFKGLKRFNRNLDHKDGVDLQQRPAAGTRWRVGADDRAAGGSAATTGRRRPRALLAQLPTPYLALLATGVDTQNALSDLAELQGPIAAEVNPDSGTAPVFELHADRRSGGAQPPAQPGGRPHLRRLGRPSSSIGTSPLAVSRARSDADPLSDSAVYQDATDGLPDSVSMLLYVNTRALARPRRATVPCRGSGLRRDRARPAHAHRARPRGRRLERRARHQSADHGRRSGRAAAAARGGAAVRRLTDLKWLRCPLQSGTRQRRKRR